MFNRNITAELSNLVIAGLVPKYRVFLDRSSLSKQEQSSLGL